MNFPAFFVQNQITFLLLFSPAKIFGNVAYVVPASDIKPTPAEKTQWALHRAHSSQGTSLHISCHCKPQGQMQKPHPLPELQDAERFPKWICTKYICLYTGSQGTWCSETSLSRYIDMWQGHVAVAGHCLRKPDFRGAPLYLETLWMSSCPDFSRAGVPGRVVLPQGGGSGTGLSVTPRSGVVQEKTGTSSVLQTSGVPVQLWGGVWKSYTCVCAHMGASLQAEITNFAAVFSHTALGIHAMGVT